MKQRRFLMCDYCWVKALEMEEPQALGRMESWRTKGQKAKKG